MSVPVRCAGTSPRRPRRRASALAVAIPAAVAVVAVLLAACGGSGGASSAQLRQPNSVTVYSSLPMHGTSGAVGNDVVSGIELALTEAHGRAGRFRVIYGSEQRLDDGSGAAAGWDPSRAAANARRAAADADAVYYIGELEPIASAISMPILKLAGIPQVSLGSLVPGDPVEAAAQLMALRSKGCTKVAVGYDEAQAALAAGIKATAANYGVEIVSETLLRPGLQSEYSFPVSVHQSGADCVVLAGSVAVDHKVLITTRIHQLLPKAWIIGSAGMCTRAWTNAGYGGVLSPVDSFLMCTRPLPIARYPGEPRSSRRSSTPTAVLRPARMRCSDIRRCSSGCRRSSTPAVKATTGQPCAVRCSPWTTPRRSGHSRSSQAAARARSVPMASTGSGTTTTRFTRRP